MTDTITFTFDDFFAKEVDDLAVPVTKRSKNNGMVCCKCQDFCPYIEEPNQADGTFKCWSCRN